MSLPFLPIENGLEFTSIHEFILSICEIIFSIQSIAQWYHNLI